MTPLLDVVIVGAGFAGIEGALETALMSRRYTYELIPGFPDVPEATFKLRPRHGLRMIAHRRPGAAAGAVAA
jgi:hypothetical protein